MLPQLDFPRFDGSNPRIWKKKCENFFEIYVVPPEMWVKLATMYFVGSADFWLQAIEPSLVGCSWKDFCSAVCGRFEKEQLNALIRQFFHIKQLGNVAEYVEQFDALVHQLLAPDSNLQPAFITSRFIDGLREDIKAIVTVHRPVDLDAACSLALLQEEVTGEFCKKDFRKFESTHKGTRGISTSFPGATNAAASHSKVTFQVSQAEDEKY